MSDLNEASIFAKVARAGSFTRASGELGMPKSTVSKKVLDLEKRLGVRLIQRSTRKLSLTAAGRTFYQYVDRGLLELEAGERALHELEEQPRGVLRVTAPMSFTFIGPLVGSFLKAFRHVQLDLSCTDRLVSLIDEGFDLAIRAGQLHDSTLVARPLTHFQSVVVCSPGFAKQTGNVKTPLDLAKIDCLSFGVGTDRTSWTLTHSGEVQTVNVRAKLIANDLDMLEDATRAGVGCALIPTYRCDEALRRGRLVRLLPRWATPSIPVHAVYPSARFLSPKVRAFVEHLRASLDPAPWLKRSA
jgi:DNA-binding transcriptional LysR family regulator